MPDAPSREMKGLIDALNVAFERPPRDLPEGTMELAKQLGQQLKGYGGDEPLSPGEREAKAVQAPSSDEALPYTQAAKGPDQPSPGQVEAQNLAKQAREFADTLSPAESG